MQTSDFDYDLPQAFIAQSPLAARDSSRLLVLNRETGILEHRIFREIGDYLLKDDLLVLNQTRVIPARVYARKPTGGRVELLLLRRRDLLTWEALVGGKALSAGKTVQVEEGPEAVIIGELDGAARLVQFSEPIEPFFPRVGRVPLPPYIRQELADPERYQTVYAREPGSAAAPTAGLHFTQRLLGGMEQQGVRLAYVTLHVGLDTFAPVTENDPREHKIHSEWCELSRECADLINETRHKARRIIAVGTTSARVLESAFRNSSRAGSERLTAYTGQTDLYILPGFQFKLVDGLITNFHLPRSTLLMLVSAFAGRERILQAYATAIQSGYRFYSFGDAMLIL